MALRQNVHKLSCFCVSFSSLFSSEFTTTHLLGLVRSDQATDILISLTKFLGNTMSFIELDTSHQDCQHLQRQCSQLISSQDSLGRFLHHSKQLSLRISRHYSQLVSLYRIQQTNLQDSLLHYQQISPPRSQHRYLHINRQISRLDSLRHHLQQSLQTSPQSSEHRFPHHKRQCSRRDSLRRYL